MGPECGGGGGAGFSHRSATSAGCAMLVPSAGAISTGGWSTTSGLGAQQRGTDGDRPVEAGRADTVSPCSTLHRAGEERRWDGP